MPPDEQIKVPVPVQEPVRPNGFVRFLKIIGTSFLILIAVLLAIDFIANNGASYFVKKAETKRSPPKDLAQYVCDSDYVWKITEDDEAKGGNKFELGIEPYTIKVRTLYLLKSDAEIANVTSEDRFITNVTFPTTDDFDLTLVLDKGFSSLDMYQYWKFISIPNTKIDRKDFQTVATCLKNHLSEINELMAADDSDPMKHLGSDKNRAYPRMPFGFIMLANDLVETRTHQQDWTQVYVCSGGEKVMANENTLYLENRNESYVVGFDGKIYSSRYYRDWTFTEKPQTLPTAECVNESGSKLDEVLRSLPSRILSI